MSKLQKISIIGVLCVAAVIALPIIRGYQIHKAEESASPEVKVAREVEVKVEVTENKDTKVWEKFRGLKWGVSREDIDDKDQFILRDASGDERVKVYEKVGDGKSIGNAQPVDVFYLFYKDKFFGVNVRCYGQANFKELLQACFTYYGPGKQLVGDDIPRWDWPQETTNGEVYAIMLYDEESDSGEQQTQFTLWWAPLTDQRERDDKVAATSGVDF